ncbi:2'-N-acetylparomamine deacetylase [Methanosarcinales archaeon]|nr:2'-N-acetylparomamine deacetylase [Methanosarcinales archaeon]
MDNEIKTILVSPHSDDIAYSIGGTLLQNFFNRPILMVTIFTKSNYSPSIKISGSKIISKVRRLEDIGFADKLEMEYQSLNFNEPPLRGYSRVDIFANNNPTSDPIYTEVHNNLLKLIKSYRCNLIVSPMGLGNHIDHIMLCDICYRIAKENNIKIVFYEDLQYASMLTLKQIKDRANSINPNLKYSNINISSIFHDKIENMKFYKTQARRTFFTMIKSHALRLGIQNKSLIEMFGPYNLYKYLLFLFTNKKVNIPLYERIWYCENSEQILKRD